MMGKTDLCGHVDLGEGTKRFLLRLQQTSVTFLADMPSNFICDILGKFSHRRLLDVRESAGGKLVGRNCQFLGLGLAWKMSFFPSDLQGGEPKSFSMQILGQ